MLRPKRTTDPCCSIFPFRSLTTILAALAVWRQQDLGPQVQILDSKPPMLSDSVLHDQFSTGSMHSSVSFFTLLTALLTA
jgi:hypothetical protein